MANQFLSLSLFLMLLSFFIVLNALSDFEDDKSKPVLNSLTLAFTSNERGQQEQMTAPVPSTQEGRRDGDTLGQVEGLFDAHIAGFEAKKNRFGTVMHVRVPVGRFENAIDFTGLETLERPLGTQGSFVQTMVSLLRSAEENKPYRMDMVLNIPAEPALYADQDPDQLMRYLSRVSAFAERLETVGMPQKMMSIGLRQGEEGFVDLYFYEYTPFDLISDSDAVEDL